MLQEERTSKEALSAQLRYLQEHGALEAVQYLENQEWGVGSEGPGITSSPRALERSVAAISPNGNLVTTHHMVKQLAEVRAEMEMSVQEDTQLQDSLIHCQVNSMLMAAAQNS